MPRSRKLALIALVLLAGAAVYGFLHEHLIAQDSWAPTGQTRFILYAVVYWAAAGVLLLGAPRWFGVAAGAFVVLYSIWWSGLAAPLAALYFMGSCYLTGRIASRRSDPATATLIGMSAAILAIWIALHFPVNTRAMYTAAFGVPYLWEARRLRKHFRFQVLCESRKEAAGLAVLMFLLLAHFLAALTPEISDDSLSVHLALPMAVAHDGRWAFDFHQYTWSLMPSGGDCLFTAPYVLAGAYGGEAAAHMVNFALLVLIAAMIVQVSRRWLVAALFVSTPLVQLVTGSLFVENVWASLILAASLAIARYEETGEARELPTAGVLFGTALAVKLGAIMFLAPAAVIAGWIAVQRKQARALVFAGMLLAIAAAPPYLYAYVKSGNPIFPFANAVFRSPYFETATSFKDARFVVPLSWRTPYLATFRSSLFFEGRPGSPGFQYFLLLVPAAILAIAARRRTLLVLLGIAAPATLILFSSVPNLRYLYPALPLFSIVNGIVLEQLPGAAIAFVTLIAMNSWFLPAAGWYHRDFALFRKSQVAQYLEFNAPERLLIERLNRTAPGQPVAFFSSDAVAGLHAATYTNTWHSSEYSKRLAEARSAEEVAEILRERNIRHIIAPLSLETSVPLLDTFLREWAEPDGAPSGRMSLFLLRDVSVPRTSQSIPPGAWDDLDNRIDYQGQWIRDRQFVQSAGSSLTYSDVPGDSLRFSFMGSGIAYIYTKALNRGIALVLIDGTERARIDMYSRETVWRSEVPFRGLTPGKHTFEVRVTGTKNPRSSGIYVDLDGMLVDAGVDAGSDALK